MPGLGACYSWGPVCSAPASPCSQAAQKVCPDTVVWFWGLAAALGVALVFAANKKR